MFLTQSCVLSAMITAAETIGTRGGSLVSDKLLSESNIFSIKVSDKSEFDNKRIISKLNTDGISSILTEVTPIPKSDLWFENVWNDYMSRWSQK